MSEPKERTMTIQQEIEATKKRLRAIHDEIKVFTEGGATATEEKLVARTIELEHMVLGYIKRLSSLRIFEEPKEEGK